ncbi:MAG: coproporphyrinogen-III oxidase family protein, partial [Pseudomonadota bacterium]
MSPSDSPLSAYVHLPWCVQKCPYCDFNSHGLRGALPEAAYLEALKRDIDAEASRHDGRRIETLFFGGGTPSLFSADAIGHILTWLDTAFGFAASPEITLEANPGTAEAGRFAGFRAAGVNRLSIGVQSFDNRRLAVLGRIHSAADAEHAFALARRAGFDNINLDLMFALPGQSVAAA